MLTNDEIIRHLKKFKFVEVYPVLQNKDIMQFMKDVKLINNKDITSPFNLKILENNNHQNLENSIKNNIDNKKDFYSELEILESFGVNKSDVDEYFRCNKFNKNKNNVIQSKSNF